MRQQALLEMQRGISSGQSPGQGGMMNPIQAVPGQAIPSQGGISAGQGGMMSPGQAAPGQGGMMGKP